MFDKLANIFRIPDLRKRILFTLAMLFVYRLGGHLPTPGINTSALESYFQGQAGGLFGFVDLFSGGQLRRMTIFALGIMPYITASIILQLLTVVYEPLAKLQKEGELGRKKITQWTRYITVILASVQSFGIGLGLQKGGFALHPGTGFLLMTMLTLTTGSAFIMWLGEQITDRGVGNGMSLLIFAGIVVGLPRGVVDLIGKARNAAWGAMTFPLMVFLIIFMLAVVAFIVYVERSERRIPVQYAKRVVGRKVMGGQSTHLPLRVNAGGVMPVIFASSILSLPAMLGAGLGLTNNRYVGPLFEWLKFGEPLYALAYAVGIIFFAYFYVSIVFNPSEVADNMRKYGGFIPGIRPGKRTADFINEVLTRITLVGALYLIIISFIPEWMITGIHLNHLYGPIGRFFESLPNWVTNGLGVNFYFGGTSLLIVVGVAMDTVQQIEAQLIMRHYDGFTPRSGRIRGRRTW
jgi:preprotein translocase subunit SecY